MRNIQASTNGEIKGYLCALLLDVGIETGLFIRQDLVGKSSG